MTSEEMRREMMLNGNEELTEKLIGTTAYYDKGGRNYGHGTVLSANFTSGGRIMLILDRGMSGKVPEIVMQQQVYELRRTLRPAGLYR